MPSRDLKPKKQGAEAAAEAFANREPIKAAQPEKPKFEDRDTAREIMRQPEFHEVQLLDGKSIMIRQQLTVKDIEMERLDTKLGALFALINTKGLRYEKGVAEAMLADDEDIQEKVLEIAAKLAGVNKNIFNKNISGSGIAQLAAFVMQLLLAVLQPKTDASNDAQADGGSEAKN